jgi:hypothetical protein
MFGLIQMTARFRALQTPEMPKHRHSTSNFEVKIKNAKFRVEFLILHF